MFFIGKGDKERIIEDGLGFLKTDLMLFEIGFGLLGVPFEYEFHQG